MNFKYFITKDFVHESVVNNYFEQVIKHIREEVNEECSTQYWVDYILWSSQRVEESTFIDSLHQI